MPAEPKIKRYLRYKPNLVTYLDILGFRELVYGNSPNRISWAIRQVKQITEPNAHTNMHEGENYVNFSDSIVHTVPLEGLSQEASENIVLSQIKYTSLVQAVLIEKELLLRGAITVGLIEKSWGVLFGPGLISAYELERDFAVYSRIVIDHELLKTLKTENSSKVLADCLRVDDDGHAFIDYLGFMQKATTPASYAGLLAKHKRLIDKNLSEFKDKKRVLSKYLWLRKYHNAVVRATIPKGEQKTLYVERPETASQVPSLTPDPF